jgi:hypothetical protein
MSGSRELSAGDASILDGWRNDGKKNRRFLAKAAVEFLFARKV